MLDSSEVHYTCNALIVRVYLPCLRGVHGGRAGHQALPHPRELGKGEGEGEGEEVCDTEHPGTE